MPISGNPCAFFGAQGAIRCALSSVSLSGRRGVFLSLRLPLPPALAVTITCWHRLCVGDIGETGTLQLLDVWAKVREWQRGAHCDSLRPLRDPTGQNGCRVCSYRVPSGYALVPASDNGYCQILTGAGLWICARGL